MIVNPNVSYRTPRVLSDVEIAKCKSYIETVIRNYITGGPKQFCVKDIFGYENWNWSIQFPAIQCIYERWCEKYTKIHKDWSKDDISDAAYKQAGISLGYLVKQTARDMNGVKFEISNPSSWNIIYKII